MALLHMAQMLTPFKILHLEPTDACNAACPQCSRETDTSFDKKNLHHLTIEQIRKQLGDDIISNLDKMFMCGDYGDPAAGKHTLDIYRYFRTVNPGISLGMNSNGGLRDQDWWHELGIILNTEKDYSVFSIDGLEDTNHIYRINVNWNKVIENAQAFIKAGGRAHWDMLVFEHNEHQVNACEQLARDLGFKWFRAKITRRHEINPVKFLNPPKGWKNPTVRFGNISCQALNEQSRYMSAEGVIYPCCYLGITDNSIDQFETIKQSWKTDQPNDMCYTTCRSVEEVTSFTGQWQHEVEFK